MPCSAPAAPPVRAEQRASARHEAWEIVRNLASLGKTVVLTTHYMDEAQFLADRVAVIARGRIVAEGAPATLGRRDEDRVRIQFRVPPGVASPPGVAWAPDADGAVDVRVDDPVRFLHEVTGWAIEAGIGLVGLEVTRPSLEEVYLRLTDSEAGE